MYCPKRAEKKRSCPEERPMSNKMNQQAKLDDKDFIRYKLFEQKKSLFPKYCDLMIGNASMASLIQYELLTTIIGSIPGAAGLLLRKLFYRRLFRSIGKGAMVGKSVTLRHPSKIQLGARSVIDDYALLDARGSAGHGIVIGDDVFIGRAVTIQSKVGPITIGNKVNIGAHSSLVAQGGIHIGDMVNMGGGCIISGGAYDVGRDASSQREHGKHTMGPVKIGNKCRLGMGAIVLDGVCIKEGTIVGAMSLVTGDLPSYSVAAGIPAKVLYSRNERME